MRNVLTRFLFVVLPLMLFFFVTSTMFAIQTSQDTLTRIEKNRIEASNNILTQDFERAIIKIGEASMLATAINDELIKADVLLISSELQYHLHNFEKALTENLKAIGYLEKTTNESKLAEAYSQYGSILTLVGDYENARKYLKDADEIFTKLNDEENQSRVLLGMGILELKKGNSLSAVNYFDAVIPLFQSFGLQYYEGLAQLKKADALLQINEKEDEINLELAIKSFAAASKIIDSNSYIKLKIDSYKIAGYIALKQNDYQASHSNLEIYQNKTDSIYHEYSKVIAKGLTAETDFADLTDIINKQKNDLEKNDNTINFGKLTNGLSIALIIILSLLTLSLYKNNNLRAKANELLQDKNNELLLAKEKAEKASLAKAQFLSTITHELRTPLYAVTGLTHLLMEENPKEYQKEHLNSLKFSGEYLLSLINNILDLNKLEANKVEVEKTTFNLKKRVNDVLIALKKSADDKKTNLRLEFDETIPTKLDGDPLKLSQILINLIGNSVKFTQNGIVTVRVQKLEENDNKIELHFEVEDNGVGISKKKQKSIFETFSQGSLQINRKFGGTGLGLSIVKNLLELMNSKIQLESELGKGSKFWFNITLHQSKEIKEETSPSEILIDIDYSALENKNILVVEDNKINQMITKKILEKNKMNCQVADNGKDAVKMVKENVFDLVLMDIHMPGISGIEATEKIREFNKQLPIIALTAITIDENLDDFYRAGFNDIIPKPFKPEEFFGKIYRTIGSKNQTADIS